MGGSLNNQLDSDESVHGNKLYFSHKKARLFMSLASEFGSPTWARTRDTWINSPLLYQLSYWGIDAYSTYLTPVGQDCLH